MDTKLVPRDAAKSLDKKWHNIFLRYGYAEHIPHGHLLERFNLILGTIQAFGGFDIDDPEDDLYNNIAVALCLRKVMLEGK